MMGLVAGGRSQDGQAVLGDFRCVSGLGVAATSAFLHVDNPDGTVLVDLRAVNTAPADAVTVLQAQYEAWRMTCPCGVCGVQQDELSSSSPTNAPAGMVVPTTGGGPTETAPPTSSPTSEPSSGATPSGSPGLLGAAALLYLWSNVALIL